MKILSSKTVVSLLVVAAFVSSGCLGADNSATLTGRVLATIVTTKGTIQIELDGDKAPITVLNFINYAKQGHYEGTTFHRCLPDFVIQGGGFTAAMKQKTTGAPITCESNNGLKNVRGSVAMARTSDPHSATSQFFINIADHPAYDYPATDGWGYAVFGRVTQGLDVCEAISRVATKKRGIHENAPVQAIVITKITVNAILPQETAELPDSISKKSVPVPAIITYKQDQPQIKILSEESVNVTGWITAPLDVAVPEQIWENLNFLKEALKDEAAQKPAANPASYQLAVRLCLKMLENLADRDAVSARAGGAAVLHQKSNLTQQNRDHLTWPQYALERDERAERKENAKKADKFMNGHIMIEWSGKAATMRKDIQFLYSQFREAMRQTPVTK